MMALNRLLGGVVGVQKKDVIANEIVAFGVSDFSPKVILIELKSWMCNRVGYILWELFRGLMEMVEMDHCFWCFVE